jgi:hypothetical protein
VVVLVVQVVVLDLPFSSFYRIRRFSLRWNVGFVRFHPTLRPTPMPSLKIKALTIKVKAEVQRDDDDPQEEEGYGKPSGPNLVLIPMTGNNKPTHPSQRS